MTIFATGDNATDFPTWSDDAVDTLHAAISDARSLLNLPNRNDPKEPS